MRQNVDGTYTVYYPKTIASNVEGFKGASAEDHVLSNIHILRTEVSALRNANAPNGYLKLNDKGVIPLENINESYVSIKDEQPDIPSLLRDSTSIPGGLVMVLDATGDSSVKEGWAIYRRTQHQNFTSLSLGWEKIIERESIDVAITWETINGRPMCSAVEIEHMVDDTHIHQNIPGLDDITETSAGKPAYKGKVLAYMSEVTNWYTGDFVGDTNIRSGDFWLKPTIGQMWWSDPSYEYAGETCYERYRDQDSLTISPKIRTGDSKSFCRMFYRCYDLETVQQYDTKSGLDFTGMYQECASVEYIPPTNTFNGLHFDNMFYSCSKLVYSPELMLNNALTVEGLFSGCVNLKRVLPLGSTKTVTNMKRMFNGCTSLMYISSPIDFSGIIDEQFIEEMFNGCESLEEVDFVEKTLSFSISLENTNLTKTSILNIFKGLNEVIGPKLVNLTGVPEANNLTSDDISIASNKGWQVIF